MGILVMARRTNVSSPVMFAIVDSIVVDTATSTIAENAQAVVAMKAVKQRKRKRQQGRMCSAGEEQIVTIQRTKGLATAEEAAIVLLHNIIPSQPASRGPAQ